MAGRARTPPPNPSRFPERGTPLSDALIPAITTFVPEPKNGFDWARILVFTLWEEECAFGSHENEEDVIELTDDVLNLIYHEVSTKGRAKGYRRHNLPTKSLVREWIENPDENTPFLDEIALDRAMEFDWDVIDNLTKRERHELHNRLAPLPSVRVLTRGSYGYQGDDDLPLTHRERRYREGSQEQVDSVRRGIDRARRRLGLAAKYQTAAA